MYFRGTYHVRRCKIAISSDFAHNCSKKMSGSSVISVALTDILILVLLNLRKTYQQITCANYQGSDKG